MDKEPVIQQMVRVHARQTITEVMHILANLLYALAERQPRQGAADAELAQRILDNARVKLATVAWIVLGKAAH